MLLTTEIEKLKSNEKNIISAINKLSNEINSTKNKIAR